MVGFLAVGRQIDDGPLHVDPSRQNEAGFRSDWIRSIAARPPSSTSQMAGVASSLRSFLSTRLLSLRSCAICAVICGHFCFGDCIDDISLFSMKQHDKNIQQGGSKRMVIVGDWWAICLFVCFS